MTKYLLLYRSPADQAPNAQAKQPSPEEVQQMMKQWDAWKQKFSDNILDLGDGLNPGGRVLNAEGEVSDGPFMEVKEVLGGFSIVQAESYDQVLDIVRECPVRHMPGNNVEIREMAGY